MTIHGRHEGSSGDGHVLDLDCVGVILLMIIVPTTGCYQ